MKNFFLLTLLAWSLSTTVSAQDVEKWNTGVLPTLWYSSVEVYEGESVRIYGGIQNHSEVEFSGRAVFLLDGEELSSSAFTSRPEELLELESKEWLAVRGKHTLELKLVELKPAGSILAETSGEIELEVKRRMTLESVKESASEVAETVVARVEVYAERLADKILGYQKPVVAVEVAGESAEEESKSVLGTSTRRAPDTETPRATSMTSVYNLVIGFLSGVVREWQWTLGVLAGLWLLSKLWRRG